MTEKILSLQYRNNPFPKQLAVSLEGKTDSMSLSMAREHTLVLPSFTLAKRELEFYLSDYTLEKSGGGAAFGIKGAYGSGKTHLMRYLMQAALSQGQDLQQIYVKMESSDFLALYRRIMTQIDYKTLQEININLLNKIAQREAQKAEITKAAIEPLQRNPNVLYQYLNEGLLSHSRIQGAHQTWVQDVTHYQDFIQAVAYLNDPLLGREAYNWLIAQDVSSTNLHRLGIQHKIDQVERAKVGLRFIVTLFGQARRPLLLYIDQIERLLVDTPRKVRSTNIGALHSLAEICGREQGFLCLAGMTEAWKLLPEDFFARLRFRLFDLSPLGDQEAFDLIKLYLLPEGRFEPYMTEKEIFPYTEATIREMVYQSHGNLRFFLLLAYQTFAEANPREKIQPELVTRIASMLGEDFSKKREPESVTKLSWLLDSSPPIPLLAESEMSRLLRYRPFNINIEDDLNYLFGHIGGFWSRHSTYAAISSDFSPEVILARSGRGKTAFAFALSQIGDVDGNPLERTLPILISSDNHTFRNVQSQTAEVLLDFVRANQSMFSRLEPPEKKLLTQLWVNEWTVDGVKVRLKQILEADEALARITEEVEKQNWSNQEDWLQHVDQSLGLLGFDRALLIIDFNQQSSDGLDFWLQNMQRWEDHSIILKIFLPESLQQHVEQFLHRVKISKITWTYAQIDQMVKWRFARLAILADLRTTNPEIFFDEGLYDIFIEQAQGSPHRLVKLWHYLFEDHLNNTPDQTTFSKENLTRAVQEVSLRDDFEAMIGKSNRRKNALRLAPKIAIITALPKEYAAMDVMLEKNRDYVVMGRGPGRRYVLGEIPSSNNGRHVLVLSLAQMGNNIATTRATLLLEHFPTIDSIIMIGIASGVPHPEQPDEHVRLGDVVVSNQQGIVQYDLDKETSPEIDEYNYPPRPPSAILLQGIRLFEAAELKGDRPWLEFIEQACKRLNVTRPPVNSDILTCSTNEENTISHPKDPKRIKGQPRIFIGPIAAANRLLKNPLTRDDLRDKFGVKALEMEDSGIADVTWNHEVSYLVVRGICDYGDSDKGDDWQNYAAIVAAAYVRALLESIPS